MSDLRLPSQLQGITAPWPVPNYTAWWQRHMCVNNLPEVLTWKWNGHESNPRPFVSWHSTLTITPPHHPLNSTGVAVKCADNIPCFYSHRVMKQRTKYAPDGKSAVVPAHSQCSTIGRPTQLPYCSTHLTGICNQPQRKSSFSRVQFCFCSLAVLDPRACHTMDLLSPFISVLSHSDWPFHGESCPHLDAVIQVVRGLPRPQYKILNGSTV